MGVIESSWFHLEYVCKQLFYHVPRECGTFWVMITAAIFSLAGSIWWLQRLMRARWKRRLRLAARGESHFFPGWA